MMRLYWFIVAITGISFLVGWFLLVGLPRWSSDEVTSQADAVTGMATDGETADATLFYVSEDGMRLVEVQQRLEWHATVAEQARAVLEAQLPAPAPPLLAPIPVDTEIRAIYVTEQGHAFVDLTEEVTLDHSGGSLDELFTVYAIVNALTTNLPSVTAVQLLIEGQEVDTLVGHVDLRRPLERNLQWIGSGPNS